MYFSLGGEAKRDIPLVCPVHLYDSISSVTVFLSMRINMFIETNQPWCDKLKFVFRDKVSSYVKMYN